MVCSEIACIEPDEPWQNGLNESFKGRLGDEPLNAEWFANRAAADGLIEASRSRSNEHHPHSSPGTLTLMSQKNRGTSTPFPTS